MPAQTKTKKTKSMSAGRKNLWLLIVALVALIASVAAFMPPSEKINQGLDIQGGLSVVLEANNSDGTSISEEDLEKSRAIIESRVNALGANEATVAIQGDNQILVQIPGVSDPASALDTIGKTGHLEFARLDSFTDSNVIQQIQSGNYGTGYTLVTDEFGNQFPVQSESSELVVQPGTYTPLITGSNISRVQVDRASETSSYYAVDLKLDSAGSQAFAQATRELYPTHGQIVIILDGVVQSAPAVQSEITGGEVSITGNYTLEQAKSLQTVLESGSLPVNFEYAQSQIVGPTLGQDALASGVMVALIGLAIVMLYLLFFYKGLGLLTAAAMIVFASIYLGVLAFLSSLGQFSLTLAGVAGIVLTIGMAADSSILTLERFREEIRMGKSIKAASVSGVHHAIITTIDAALVTLVSALCLFFLASASVKGFGMTLALGIFCDIFMVLVFKAPLIRVLAPRVIAKNPGFWDIQDSLDAVGGKEVLVDEAKTPAQKIAGRFIKRDIMFMNHRKKFLTIAAVCIVLSCLVFGIRGLNFGIEFVGGSSISYNQVENVTEDQLRDEFAALGFDDVTIQTASTAGEEGYLIRLATTDAQAAADAAVAVAQNLGISENAIEYSSIGPDWGSSVIKSSLVAFLISLLLIIAYIGIRFEYKMGVVAIVTLLHDLIIVVGIYALVGREMTPNTIAALLTILGYSLYDKVVVFHRINDNMKSGEHKVTFMTMANHSINQVFLRTINTSLTSLIPVLFMLLFGSETLQDFAFAMVIGLALGSYSSIAVATPLFAMWKSKEEAYAKAEKKYGTEVRAFEFRLPEVSLSDAASSEEQSAANDGVSANGVASAGSSALKAQESSEKWQPSKKKKSKKSRK